MKLTLIFVLAFACAAFGGDKMLETLPMEKRWEVYEHCYNGGDEAVRFLKELNKEYDLMSYYGHPWGTEYCVFDAVTMGRTKVANYLLDLDQKHALQPNKGSLGIVNYVWREVHSYYSRKRGNLAPGYLKLVERLAQVWINHPESPLQTDVDFVVFDGDGLVQTLLGSLHHGAANLDDEIIQLVERGANLTGWRGRRHGLASAILNDRVELAKYFVQRSEAIGDTVHLAVRNKNVALVKYLLDNGGDVNVTKSARSLLHTLLYYPDLEMLRLLLDYGIDTGHRNDNGRSALEVLLETPAMDHLPELKKEFIKILSR